MRSVPLVIYGAAVALGVVAATALFPPHKDSFVLRTFYEISGVHHDPTRFSSRGLRYSGTVVSQDSEAQTLTLSVPSSYAFSTSTTPVRFIYGSYTKWSSFEYTFKDSILETRTAAKENPRSFPEGTLVTLVVDPHATSPLTATAIYFLRKNEL